MLIKGEIADEYRILIMLIENKLDSSDPKSKLSIHVNKTAYVAIYGTPVTLECNVTWNPNLETVHVYWTKVMDGDLTQMNAGYPGTEGMTMEDPSLTVTFPTFDDTAQYICAAKSQVSNITGQPINLNVIGGTPNVTIDSTLYEVVYGQTITLECNVTSIPVNTNVYWQKIKDGTVTNITSFNLNVNGVTTMEPSLTILKATMTDSGMYACHAENLIGTGQSDFTNLTVVGDIPSVEVGSTFRIVEYGHNVTLDCNATSFPAHTSVYWQRISTGTTTNITSDNCDITCIVGVTILNPSLTILMATTADSGLYTCYITNKVGTGYSEVVNLTIIGDIPNVEVGSTTQIVEYGRNVILDCNVTSFPAHTSVYWQRKSIGLTTNITSDNFSSEDGTTLNNSLTISIAKPADTGLYTCYAINIVGTGRSKAINLTIIGGIPMVRIDETRYNVEYGQPFTVECKITSIPSYTHIYWQKEIRATTTNITSDFTVMESVALTTTSISIPRAIPADSGMYTCYAVNIAGTGHSGSVNLTVYGGIPIVTTESDFSDIPYGHNHTIRCSITAVPVFTTIYWQKIFNGTTINITSNSPGIDGARITRPSLTILKAAPSDSGQYICFAVNIAGIGHSNSINLTVLGEENYPIVGIQLDRYVVRFGESLTIKSDVQRNEEFPVRSIQWQYVNNGVLTTIEAGTNGIAGSTTETPSLTIATVTTSESGLYTCLATNDIGTGISKQINVTVVGGLPIVSVKEKKYVSMYSHEVILIAVVKADPPAKFVYWEKIVDGRRSIINNGAVGTFGVTPINPSLTVKYSTKADFGTYRCFATNDVGTGHGDIISLQVIGENPSVFVPLDKISANFGAKMKLLCTVESTLPITIVYWERIINGVLSRVNHGTVGTDGINAKNPSLTILHSTSADSGFYTCFAGNVVGINHSSPINVTVVGGMPAVSIGSLYYNTTYGNEIKLECRVTAYPSVTLVYWQKTIGDVITTLNEGTIGTRGINITMPSLIIMFPTTADSGSYTCFASNSAGTQKSLPAKLNIEGGLPFVTIRSPQYTAHYGDSVTLECDINAIPAPTRIFWYKTVNGIRIEMSNGFAGTLGITLNNPSLTIVFATSADTGRYTCFAQNAAGIGQSQSTMLEILADIPKVIVLSESYTTGISYSVTLLCRITIAIPAVSKVYWQRYINNSTTVITYDSIGIDGVTVDNPSLTIFSAKESMSGEYTCFAINLVGTGSSLPTRLKAEIIVNGVIGTVGALAAIVATVIAYWAYRRQSKGNVRLFTKQKLYIMMILTPKREFLL
ncbi:HMCN [Mytilus coruscus]|uniref:HMCN n=1 Tax=Mytilus coruscus TaxID=42192 RepID=A0A6J8AJT2_MYTCO|nr:HMCN [Mytilus coruscus]